MNVEAPAGIPPLLWLGIFLLVGPPALLSKSAARMPWLLGAAARWWQSREPASASYRVSQAEIERIRTDYKRILEDYDDIVDRLEAVEAKLTVEIRLRWDAVGYARVLANSHRRVAPEAPIPEPPESLRDIL